MSITSKCPKDKLYKNSTTRCKDVHLLLNLKAKLLLCLPSRSSFSKGNIKQYILKVRVIEKLPKLDTESSEKKKRLFYVSIIISVPFINNTSLQYPPSGGSL
jgi:hypothetical protein